MNKFFSAVLSMCVMIFTIAYVSVMVYRYNYTPYKTETALTYSMDDSFTAKSAFVRSEIVIPNSPGVLGYRASNGEIVLKGDIVADVFASGEDIERKDHITSLTHEIENLKQAQNSVHSGFNTVSAINAQVEEQLRLLTLSAAYGRMENADVHVRGITYNINRKQVAIGREKDYAQRIAYLDAEAVFLMRGARTVQNTVPAPATGYFSSKTDGFESTFSADSLSLLRDDEVARLISGELVPAGEVGAGKIVTSHNYYVAALVKSDDVGRFAEGAMVKVSFSNETALDIGAQIARSRPLESGDYIVYMRLSNINDYLLAQRTANVVIKFSTITGIRLSSSAVRYIGPQAGTYVLHNGRIIFKPIELIHEEPGFVLCKPADITGAATLRMYDQVIVSGTDLYDGKVVG